MDKILFMNPFKLDFAPAHKWLNRPHIELHMLLGKPSLKDMKKSAYEALLRKNLSFTIINDDNYNYSSLVISEAMKLIEQHKINRIVYVHESDVERAASLNHRYGLQGLSLETAVRYRDKADMKLALKDVVNVAPFKVISCPSELISASKHIGFPSVLKKARGAAGIGTQIFHEFKEVLKYLESNTLSGKYLLEKFVDGEMFHVDGVAREGKITFCAVCKYHNNSLDYRKSRSFGHYMLRADDADSKALTALTQDVISTLGYSPGGAFHAEFWKSRGKYIFCEIAARAGGGSISQFFLRQFNVNLVKESLLAQLGYPSKVNSRALAKPRPIVGGLYLAPFKGLLLDLQRTCPVKGVIKYNVNGKIGEIYRGDGAFPRSIVSFLTKTESVSETRRLFKRLEGWAARTVKWHEQIAPKNESRG